MYGLSKAVKMKKYLIGILFMLIFKLAVAQQMDTILLFDYYYQHHSTWKEKRFTNGGLSIFFPNNDSLHIQSGSSSIGLNLRKHRHLIPRSNKILIEGLRIIKPANVELSIRMKSFKRFSGKNYRMDSVLVLNKNIPYPRIYWQPLREIGATGVPYFSPTHFVFANYEFAYKLNFKNPELIKKLNEAVRYEYHFPEGKLIRLW